jgi:hypothetical protein
MDKEGYFWAETVLLLGLVLLLLAVTSAAWAQSPPTGYASLNQAISARAVTKSDATLLPGTRGLYVGDATPCNLALVFKADNATGAGVAVTVSNVQPGSLLPFQVAKVMSTNTTCSSVLALY